MRILQVSNKPPYPPRDGGSLAMFSLAKALHSLGHSIAVLTMFTDKHRLTLESHQAYTKIMEVHTIYVDARVRLSGVLFNLIFSKKPFTASRFFSFHFERELIRILKNSQFDIIQLEGLYLTQYSELIRNHSSALISLRAHNVEHEIWIRIAAEEKNFLKKNYFSLVARRLKKYEEQSLNTYDLLVPITERDAEKFNKMGNLKPVHVCPAGVDLQQTNNQDNDGSDATMLTSFTLFYLGSLDWIPNQEGLLWFIGKVFPGLRQKYHDLKLHVAGRNAPRSLVEKLDMPGVVFHGEIDDPVSYSKDYTVMIAPCFSGGGMRMKIIEAMALAKPVVTTSIGAEGLVSENGVHLMIANESDTFAGCVETLMKSPELCQTIGQNAFQLVNKHYNNRDLAIDLAEFYKQHLK